jgi:ABC-type branched-subunit amino acid transport system substrate-binding protein
MTQATDHFWIKSKNSLIRVCVVVLIICFLVSCSSRGNRNRFPVEGTSDHSVQDISSLKSKADKAPWEVWTIAKFSNQDYLTALRFEEEGNLKSASDFYKIATEGAKSSEEAETYLLLHASVELKQGLPDKALARISQYAARRKLDPSSLDPRFSLLTAYCYIAKNNNDQIYAWLVQAFKGSRGIGGISEEARRVAREHTRSLLNTELDELNTKWEKEGFVSALVREEKSRRLQGGSLVSNKSFTKYFDPATYAVDINTSVQPENRPYPENNSVTKEPSGIPVSDYKLGALLPLSGQYAAHAKKVEEGIRLALRESNLEEKLVVLDSNTDIRTAYIKLKEEGSKLIYGPMLVKDVETLASLTSVPNSDLTTPLLTYAKKRGLPGLSDKIFRIGGTAENQLQSLIIFAQTKLGAKRIALLYSDGEIGQEYKDAAEVIRSRGIDLNLDSIGFQARNLSQIEVIKEKIRVESFDTVIIADVLPSAEPMLRSIKEGQSLHPVNVLGASLLADSDNLRQYADLVEGMYIVSLFNANSKKPEIVKFKDDYKKAFGRDPDLLAAQSYDSVKFSLASVLNSSSQSIAAELSKTSMVTGVTGTMHVLADGDIHRDLNILKVVSGSLFEISE